MIPYPTLHVIEKSLESFGINSYDVIDPNGSRWSFSYKNSNVIIDVFAYPDTPDLYHIQVISPLCKLVDRKKEEFAIDLLEINFNLFGCGICKINEWMYVLHLRSVEGITNDELVRTIERVAHYSIDYWNKLSFKYKGCWDEVKQI